MRGGQASESETLKWIKRMIWGGVVTAGMITPTVMYWLSQLPPAERAAVMTAIHAFLALPTK